MEQPVCICTRLRRATRQVSRAYDAALAEAGLNVAQFSLLRAIERAGRPSLTALAEATGLDASTLGRNVRVLEKAGLARFGPGKDRRTRLIELTPAGTDRIAAAAARWAAAQADLDARLGAGGRERLFALLETVEANPQETGS